MLQEEKAAEPAVSQEVYTEAVCWQGEVEGFNL